VADLLVRLLDLPELAPALECARRGGVEVRRALSAEKHLIARWIAANFSAAWASECEVAFSRQPLACFVALKEQQLCGFAVYEVTCRNFFGPLGVATDARGQHIGAALLLASLHAMRSEGYVYAIIGGAGPIAFFEKVVGATAILGSEPGIYRGMLRE
jgi:ribosomal protein S18 acetylase RimI-like enzyme